MAKLITGDEIAEMNVSKAHREDEVNAFATFPIHYKENGRCSYCGSLSPEKLVEAIKAGIHVSFADRKYGWPHKLYLDQSYSGGIKFYTAHLRDATEEQSEIIAKACGLRFRFDTENYGDVSREPYTKITG